MEVIFRIPDYVAQRLAADGDVSRRALEALALQGYRNQALTLYQVSEMLGLSRVETEYFLGQHHVPLSVIAEADLDREAVLFEATSPVDTDFGKQVQLFLLMLQNLLQDIALATATDKTRVLCIQKEVLNLEIDGPHLLPSTTKTCNQRGRSARKGIIAEQLHAVLAV
jgi:hypothetical protein